ncbi:pirin family protein [Gammaproteobacteria bacterium]|jgi:redox-sensitive bicupin YhaK (pirin superfamily)|nr:pirin family protein [Gammaproteobacteria bacterium]MDA7782304.1 pirin family protein [Gammaproteobacteria bacterium]MDA8616949.1 pirin family protein [Gammaproteobacteria bacterium]MDB2505726.1 pirin family protein [Gammaproteobacteria bacterium]MDC1232934.1 pirin family protein [Gammaproteobacteria bacterium]
MTDTTISKTERRKIEEVLVAQSASDGDGVRLKRVFGGGNLARFDPFLMLDEFGSNDPSDYIGGFPSHPHRGFETVTYMLEGHMEHRDHMGNVGQLMAGDVQWMKAGSGVIHSEMPKQVEGRMRGFQLWVNLPASEKMTPASYTELAAASIPHYEIGGIHVKAIAGGLTLNGVSVSGPIAGLATEPGYLDIAVGPAQALLVDVPEGHTALVYVYEGALQIGSDSYSIKAGNLARLSLTGELVIETDADTRLLVISGKPIGEPIVQRGPFVMNTADEIHQAIRDYTDGKLVAAQPSNASQSA